MGVADRPAESAAYRGWNKAMEWPLIVVALIFGVGYAYQVLAEPVGWPGLACEMLAVLCWLVFVVDYAARLYLATDRGRWFLRHLLSLLVVALPVLRPLRLVRLLTLLTVFQRAAGSALRGRVVMYAAATTGLLVLVSSLAVFDAERYAPGSLITSYGEAVWWACVTVTTVGYGDTYPVTFGGRCIAVAMMVCGIALLGTITAIIASWLVEQVRAEEEAHEGATRDQVELLAAQIERLERGLLAGTREPVHRSMINGRWSETSGPDEMRNDRTAAGSETSR
ncbi:potassium channel family protein [Nakamurella sp.]|uniref:potassium channel family protein n=1 Tax=Nakamurella sp. TaxID=1869182 RepID=UPI0037851570